MLLTALVQWKRQISARLRQPIASRRRQWRKHYQERLTSVERLEDRSLLSAVTGTVFDDVNGNGSQDPAEVGIADVIVYLDQNENGNYDPDETAVTSGSDGSYRFDNLTAGEYIVRQVVPDNYHQTAPSGDSRLFATTFFGTHRIQELDPADGSIINDSLVILPNQSANFSFQGLAFANDVLYYYENNEKVMYEFDADSGALLDSTSLASAFANRNIGGLAAMNGLVYILDSTSVTAAPSLLVFDPTTDAVTNTFSLAGLSVDKGFDALPSENLLVLATTNDEFKFLDPTSGAVVETRPFTPTSSNTTVTGLAVIDNEIYLTAGGRITDIFDRNGVFQRTVINPNESGGLAGGSGNNGAFRITVDGVQDVTGLNFGNQSGQASISGVKFEDSNGNGVQDEGETGLAGVTVYLDQNRNGRFDAGDISTTTADDGSYAFTNLVAGDYIIREVVPAGYLQTTQGNDPGTFYGDAYVINGNGQMNYVEIDALTGQVRRIGPTHTDALHGLVRTKIGEIYGLNGVNSDRIFRVDPTTGIATFVGNTGYEMAFGLAYDSLTDTIYGVGKPTANDTINYLLKVDRYDGSVTPIGNGVSGLTATSDLAFDPVTRRVVAFDNSDDEFVAFELDGSATRIGSAANMNSYGLTYSFYGLTFGGIGTGRDSQGNILRETIRVVDPATGNRDTVLVLSEAAPVESLDWANDPSQYRYILGDGESVSGVNFGNQFAPGSIRGTKFEDANGNGVQDQGEAGLEGVTIYLDQNRNGILDDGEQSTTTAADGAYEFTNLVAGRYFVQEVVPLGFEQTSPGQGTYYLAITRDTNSLVQVDATTGEVTVIGNHGLSFDLQGMVRTNDGELYAIAGGLSGSDEFYQLDPNTGQATLIGETRRDVGYGLAYDSKTNTIYGVANIAPGITSLVTYNRTTGAITPVSVTGMREPSGTSGIAFDDVNDRVLLYNFFDGIVYEFDTTTGLGSVLVQTQSRLGVNLTFVDGQLVIKQDFPNPNSQFLTIDLETGALTPFFQAQQGTVFESLEYVDLRGDHVVVVDLNEDVTGKDFGNLRVNSPPVANAGGPYSIDEGSGVTLNAGLSADPDNDPLTYAWDLDNDGEFDDAFTAMVDLTWNDLASFGIDDDGNFPVSVQVNDGLFNDTDTRILAVQPVAPSNIVLTVDPSVIDENGSTTLTGTFEDPGTADTHTVVIDWGDGSDPSTIQLSGERAFTATHQYLDDGSYTASVSVADDDGQEANDAAVTVNNVAPQILSFNQAFSNRTATVSGTFDDPGSLDTHTGLIEWGDGTSSEATINGHTFSATHTYALDGAYSVSVTITDNAGDQDSAEAIISDLEAGVRLEGDVLIVVGTSADDSISISSGRHGLQVKANFLPGRGETFDPADVNSIEVYLLDGSDRLRVDSDVTQPLLVVGGAGDDNITAGGGRSVILGGLGADRLKGGSNQDLIITGITAYDDNFSALRLILKDWSSNLPLQDRVSHLLDVLTVGENGTVQNDSDPDQIHGSGETDWLFYDLDFDRVRGNSRDDLFANDLDGLFTAIEQNG